MIRSATISNNPWNESNLRLRIVWITNMPVLKSLSDPIVWLEISNSFVELEENNKSYQTNFYCLIDKTELV